MLPSGIFCPRLNRYNQAMPKQVRILFKVSILLLPIMFFLGLTGLTQLYASTEASNDKLDQLYQSRPSNPEEISDFVAPLNDSQARALLVKSLKALSVKMSTNQNELSGINQKQRFNESLRRLSQQLEDFPKLFYGLFLTISGEKGRTGILWLVVAFSAMCISGFVAEKIMGHKLNLLTRHITQQNTKKWTTLLAYFLLRTIFDLIGIGFFAVAGMLTAYLFTGLSANMKTTIGQYFTALIVFRIVYILSKAVFAPNSSGIRPISINSDEAQKFHHWVLLFSAIYVIGSFTSDLLLKLKTPYELVSFLQVTCVGLSLIGILILFVWIHRSEITALFNDQAKTSSTVSTVADEKTTSREVIISVPKLVISQAWPYLFTLWVVLLWCVWAYNVFMGYDILYKRVNFAWWLTLLFPILDRLFYRLLTKIVTIKWLQSQSFPERSSKFVYVVHTGFRVLLFSMAIIAFAEAWGFGTFAIINTEIGQRIVSGGIDILITLLSGYIVWEIISSVIERKLPEPTTESGVNVEEGGGGGGASRVETLLPLLHTFLLAVIVATVIISILHSLGVQIGPLIAGAGVVGIAVGFGSQKLVQDIISGIFFLWDDAFRRGEYIQAGGLSGTVEHISIRSMRLRHHRGAVQTLPYSEINTIKNLSRDWVTMKLEIRLPYDTDIEKVRKIIKKVGKKMMLDEEIGPNMLLPLKSQGVGRVEESTLIVRMKFTCKPGEQFVIRREAFRLSKEALEAQGIHFAHREVKVALPKELEEKLALDSSNESDMSNAVRKAAGAAIGSIIGDKKEN